MTDSTLGFYKEDLSAFEDKQERSVELCYVTGFFPPPPPLL